jgi:hypothetical protein
MSVSCECCVLSGREVCVSGWSLVQRSSTECGVSECDREASIMRRPWPTRGCRTTGGKRSSLESRGSQFFANIPLNEIEQIQCTTNNFLY